MGTSPGDCWGTVWIFGVWRVGVWLDTEPDGGGGDGGGGGGDGDPGQVGGGSSVVYSVRRRLIQKIVRRI